MADADIGRTQISYARLAGFMYLFVIVADLSGMFIISRFPVPGDFLATAHRIMASEPLYRIGICGGLVGSLCTVFLAVGLFVVVKPVDGNLALIALIFRLIEATTGVVQNFFSFMILKLYVSGDYASAFGAKQLSAFVDLHSLGGSATNIGALCFGIGSTIFFYLFFKTTYIPKALSALGLFASALVPIVCIAALLLPEPGKYVQFGWLPILIAELLVGFWLLLKGVNVQPRSN